MWLSLVSSCSALRDRRFPPIQSKELPTLECTVSILTDYETAEGYLDWEVYFHTVLRYYFPFCMFSCFHSTSGIIVSPTFTSKSFSFLWMQVGKHGLIIEFTDPDYNIRRSATYLPEVASHEGELIIFHLSNAHILILRRNLLSTYEHHLSDPYDWNTI